jgi:hypothetical protein
MGLLSFVKNKSVKEKIANTNLTYQGLDEAMDAYLK